MALQTSPAMPVAYYSFGDGRPPTADERRRVLRQAKEQLLLVGWAQGTGVRYKTTKDGRDVRVVADSICLGEALATAARGMHVDIYDIVPLIAESGNIARYNDYEARSVDDVIALLDRALVTLSEKDQFDEQIVRHALALA